MKGNRFVIGLILLLLAACSLLAACGPGDWTNRLPYAGPVEKSIDQGAFLPGAPIQYLGKTTDGALVMIDGKGANKEIGDSLDWRGDVRQGIDVDQTYRITRITDEALHLGGTARIIVWNAIPEPGPANTDVPIHFEVPVGYHVKKGYIIPGTTLIYVGRTDQGAELGNIDGSPYRQVGDSITWEGKLRRGIWIELDLRTALVTEDVLDVVGAADLWIEP